MKHWIVELKKDAYLLYNDIEAVDIDEAFEKAMELAKEDGHDPDCLSESFIEEQVKQ